MRTEIALPAHLYHQPMNDITSVQTERRKFVYLFCEIVEQYYVVSNSISFHIHTFT